MIVVGMPVDQKAPTLPAQRLTAQTRAGGCASKLAPGLLDRILKSLPRTSDPNVLVGFDHNDDAGVYRLTPELAMVQTVDFFTPMVDDPWIFGQIAAANAVSDIYAMGGRPVSALSVLACPADGDLDVIEQIVRGGANKLAEAGVSVIGGHSVNDPEIKFGYAITGVIHPDQIKTNAGARPGDALLFTKSLGTGVITTALKRGIARPDDVAGAIQSMTELNRAACEAMLRFEVHSCTDVTGFGLIAHAREMAMAGDVTLEIDSQSIRILPGALDCAAAGAIPAGLKNNRAFAESCVDYAATLDPHLIEILYDPQTSGGLLISMPESDALDFQQAYPRAYRIGAVRERCLKPVVLQ